MTEAAATAPPRRHTHLFGRGCITLGVFNAVLAYAFISRCGGADYSFTADRRIRLEDLANPSYPCVVVGFNSVVRYFDLVEWLLPLDEEYLIAAATKNLRNANLTEAVFGEADDPWRDHLRQLLAAIHAEAALSPIGRFISQQQLIKSLEQRAKVNYYDRRLMITARETLARPLIVTGLPRTGTTLLHNLLTLTGHPDVQYLTYADTLQPAAEAGDAAARTEVEQAVAFMGWMRPLFSKMHEMGASLPHEELHLQALSFYSMLYESQYHVPSYGAYYENGTKPWRALHRLRSYEYVRDLLKVRQWRTREDADRKDRTFVLKSPMHLECADALLHMLPTQGFTLVRMHREPLNVVLSLATMLAYIQALQSDRPQPAAVLEYWVGRLERMLRRAVADDDRLRARENVDVVDIAYEELIRDPSGTAARVLEAHGLSVDATQRRRLKDYEESHPRNATGGGRFAYDLGVFGSTLTEGEIAARFSFYRERFLS